MLDVLVIGSGYGGSVIAARLAPHARVLVVERGRWWRPGRFPHGLAGLVCNYRSARNPTGLWSMRLGRGTGVGLACAVGGSSAVNYGITARPDDHAFDGWPLSAAELAPWYERSGAVLGAEPNPIADQLGDRDFLDQVEPGRRVDLHNTIDWAHCTQCGRCVPGCNVGAKRGLDRTYLDLAMRTGAELRAETEVRELVPVAGGWAVAVGPTGSRDCTWVNARQVVVAAGTLGTLDLLHASRLALGPALGRGLSLNGDGLAFLYDTPHRLSSHHGAPISTSVRIPFVDERGRTRTLMVMSGRVPHAALRMTAAGLVVVGAAVEGVARARRWWRRARDLLRVEADGPVSRSFMYKLDGQDAARGTVRFTGGGAVIDWSDYADDPILRFAEQRLRGWAERMGGTVIPAVARLPGGRGFSVHPLGGCRIGTSIDDGVVDGSGRVFDPRGGVYRGLRIADGSIIPDALGVPPSWTIAALAERIADDMIRERAVA